LTAVFGEVFKYLREVFVTTLIAFLLCVFLTTHAVDSEYAVTDGEYSSVIFDLTSNIFTRMPCCPMAMSPRDAAVGLIDFVLGCV